MKRSAIGVLLLLLLSAPLAAQEAEKATDPTLDAWAALLTARADAQTLKGAFSGLFQKMQTEEGKTAARAVFREVYKQAGNMVFAKETVFRESFAVSDWSKWEGEDHADMLRNGLDISAREAIEVDPALSVKAWELLVKKFPDSNEAAYARSTWLPIALPATGDLEHALERLAELREAAPEIDKPGLRMAIGDVFSMQGEFDKARVEFQGAVDEIDAAGELEKYDRRAAVKRYAELRLALVGQPAPEVDSKTWIGGDAKKLGDLKGQVVVLDYWATW